ncbi:subtilisin-like protease SBT1.7 [Magnolia sinica]|uniref:subtilisin-like protease SBT1.7 n=1 Tax=Magnolia sinica TaxID=86752 RepID=UPI00265AAA29|nr:subtilisin-like protease SBT1.7 [Magnolia sinica]
MAHHIITPSMLLSFFFLLIHVTTSSSADERRPYIIHMDKSAIPATFSTHDSWYTSTISSLSAPDGIAAVHLYTYNHVMNGFSAVMSQAQLNQLERMPGHLATYPETYAQLHTTHTPRFLGLNRHVGLWPKANFGDDTIIGIIDTGIWPESEMFGDEGMPPVPERWKGACEIGDEFNSSNCNRKLIGARSFSKGLKEGGLNISKIDDYDSPRDFYGHGTHTASTAAGSRTPNADYFGYAKGTAVGVAPMARLAMYKVLFTADTLESPTTDILAGMDQAISDGVDLMSLSLGLPRLLPYDENVIALGAFAAMERGIFVSCSAGNSGPHAYTIGNGAPWITTVAAGTIDRDYAASITLGDGITTVQGKSFYPESIYISGVPLYYGYGNASKEICDYYSLDPKDVAGKIVFCGFGDEYTQMFEVNRTGAEGAIFVTDSAQFLNPDDFFMPFVAISIKDGEIIKRYIANAAQPPTVDIKFQITVLGSKPAPQVASFSSRGPNILSPWILKPDIVAPGVHILAAWVPNRGRQPIDDDYLVSEYALVSGTSMSSPHVVGVAALLRAAHPDWSPAAIRSALMTTAYITDNTHGPILDPITGTAATPLDYGAGHIDPNKAMDPGLVYDLERQDYINFLCGLNYTTDRIKIITRGLNYTCTKATLDLNYPSFMVILNNTNSSRVVFTRVLTNVADSPSIYRAVVKAPTGMRVVVDPPELKFDSKYSKQGFTMSVQIDMAEVVIKSDYIGNYGYLNWYEDGGNHVVRTPIASAFGP